MKFSLSSSKYYPIELLFGIILDSNNNTISLPNAKAIYGEWGQQAYSTEKLEGINRIHILYYSIIEAKFYDLDIEEKYIFSENESLILGLAPTGYCQFWISDFKKRTILSNTYAIDCTHKTHLFFNQNKDLQSAWYGNCLTDGERSDKYLEILDPTIQENFSKVGLPRKGFAEKWMKQYNYRYIVKFEKWDSKENVWTPYNTPKENAEFLFIHEALSNGTIYKLTDDNLLKYHSAGKPKKIRIKWSAYDYYYNCFLWFEEETLSPLLDKICESNPETHVDFIFHFDYINNKYQVELYRYGLEQSIIIPDSAYQVLVFKEMSEHFESENYNQKHNAWYW